MRTLTPTRNPIQLRGGLTIGTVSAENDDDFLFECFIDYPAVQSCLNLQSPAMIVAGRTGSGKTAVLRWVEHQSDSVTFLDPLDMSLSYVSNSDALKFIQAIGGDLDLLFLALWKHVLCIALIRLRYKITDEEKSKSFFEKLSQRFKTDARKQKAISYLREWEGRFWITMDQNIKELTERVENKLNAEFKAELSKFNAKGQYEKQLSKEKKSEFIARARKIITPDQLTELAGVIEILSEQSTDYTMKKNYILIDKLDENWVDDSIRFRLIRSLMDSLRAFRKIRNLKILVAIRSDIIERVMQETGGPTLQREKLEDYFINIVWNKPLLRKLVESRIRMLFKRHYSPNQQVGFDDIFVGKVGSVETFDYMVDRTLMRPRDLIIFVNICLARAEGRFDIGARVLREAEAEFSRTRRQALIDEWISVLPTLPKLLDFIKTVTRSTKYRELFTQQATDALALSITSEGKRDIDRVYDLAKTLCSHGSEKSRQDFAQEVLSVLYRVGAVGVKRTSTERFFYSHIDAAVISGIEFGPESLIRVNPMLHRALGVDESNASRT